MMLRNPFDDERAAHDYVAGRPYYHADALATALGTWHVDLAVDVAAGTGLSARAAREHAERVVAIEPSSSMRAAAPAMTGVAYVGGEAENLPLAAGCTPLVTVATAFHWLDTARALAEIARVLVVGGRLVVYTDFFRDDFRDDLADRPNFATWRHGEYATRYPSPPRNTRFDEQVARAAGFGPSTYLETSFTVPMTRVALVRYLLSQSNAQVAMRDGRATPVGLTDDITAGVARSVGPDETIDASFGIRVWTGVLEARMPG